MADNTPTYNLKAVMKEVGLNAATLRAWESRYGLPKPQRTPGGQRLYTRQDIDMLKWLIEKQKDGLSISRAVEMWKTQKFNNFPSTTRIPAAGLQTATVPAAFDELREGWIAACGGYDERTANSILDQAFALAAPETICVQVLQKGLAEIGSLWYVGKFSVQQEHFATAIAMRRMNNLLAAASPATRGEKLLAICPPGEQHELILLLATYLLRRSGWEVIFLGTNVPVRDLDETIQSTQPRLIVSAAQTINSAAALRTLSESTSLRGMPLAYGGGIFTALPRLARYITGYFLGNEVIEVAQAIEQLLNSPRHVPAAIPVQSTYTLTLAKFMQNESNIISDVSGRYKNGPIEPGLITVANTELSQMISSALTLGDIELLDYSVDWLYGLLNYRGFSHSGVISYFSAYRESIDRNLSKDGSLIRDWLDKHIRNG